MLPCPICKGKSTVQDTRFSKTYLTILRRRRCLNNKCKERWSTLEIGMNVYIRLSEVERLVKAIHIGG